MKFNAGEIYLFDLETGGLRPYNNPIVSGAFSHVRDIASATETYMAPAMPSFLGDRVKRISQDAFLDKMSPWARKKLLGPWRGWFLASKTSPDVFFSRMTKELVRSARQKPTFLVAHNARFDLSFANRYLTPEDLTQLIEHIPDRLRTRAMRMALDKKGLLARDINVLAAAPPSVWNAVQKARYAKDPASKMNLMTSAYTEYRNTVRKFLSRGKGLMITDTQMVGEMTFAMAQKLGYMAPTADFATGQKLDIFKIYKMLDTSTSHVGAEDIRVTAEYMKDFGKLSEKLWHEIRTGQSSLTDEEKGMLRFYSNVQKELAPKNIRKHIAELRTELENTGRFELEWDPATRKQVYGTSMDDILNPEARIYQRYSKRAQIYGENFDDIVKEVFSAKDVHKYYEDVDEKLKSVVEKARYNAMRGEMPQIGDIAEHAGVRSITRTVEEDMARSSRNAGRTFASKAMSVLGENKKPWLMLAALGVAGSVLTLDAKETYTHDPTDSLEELHGRGKRTIHGMHERGILSEMRKAMTDFGSGYRGPNPWLHPAYNEAKDVPRYQLMRASAASHSPEDILRYMTDDRESSEYTEASASAGSALHEYLERKFLYTGKATNTERLIYDPIHQITGHIDYENKTTIGDIKTLNAGRFYTLLRNRKPYPSHMAQVNLYMGVTGKTHGEIYYINRDDPSRHKTYRFDFDPKLFYQTLKNVETARQQVEQMIASGAIAESDLPKAASIETLQSYQETNPPPTAEEVTAQDLDYYNKVFQEEMAYLRTVKRGMPKEDTAAIRRIEDANKRRRDQIDWRTAGIGLQMYKDAHRSKHFQ